MVGELIKRISSFLFAGKDRIKGEYLLVLDIGTEIVKVLIFKIEKEREKAVVLGIGRKKYTQLEWSISQNIEKIAITCQEAIIEAEDMAGLKVNQVVLGIAGQFIKGSTNSLTYLRENPLKSIDLPEIKNIFQKAQWKIFNKIRQELAEETGLSEVEIKLINGTLADLEIDGYKITNPLGFTGKELSLSIFNTYASLVHLQALQRLAQILKLEILFLVVEPYALFRSVKLPETISDCIFIDLGGQTTDIAFVCQGILEGTKSISLGGRTFTKRLTKELGLKEKEAEEIKVKYSQNQISSLARRKIAEILKNDLRIWLEGIEITFNDFSPLKIFPSLILLSGGGSLLPGIKKSLENADWQKNLPFSQPVKVDFIKTKDIINIEDKTGLVQGPGDITPLALVNFSLNKALGEPITTPILNRVIRGLMQK